FINDQPTQNISLDDAIKKLKGSIGSSITITTDQNISYTLTRDRIAFISHLKIGSDLLVIKIYMFDQYIPNRIKTILEQYPQNMNIILDIRNNKGGLVNSIEETLSLFTQPNTELFSLTDRSFKKYDTFKIVSTNPMKTVPKPVYIIINHTTASGALLFAKTMQRENAIVIGTSKETVSSSYRVITFSENNALKLPVGKFYFPDGTVASGTTVKSDIPLDTDSLDNEALYEKIATIIKNR
ncbi:S41 family peptidase, partial [Sulfuricurvum sp.]|uniref:S41 family peptidase n=1 Tax=Sulfuricurvum sp. TaxID=2025608 RepID=UPI003BB541E0